MKNRQRKTVNSYGITRIIITLILAITFSQQARGDNDSVIEISKSRRSDTLGDIYTFGPTFRAENSQTTRHLAEFNMVEPEMAFADMESAMDNAESMLQYVIGKTLENCADDLDFFTKFYDKGLKARLEKVISTPFVRVSYKEAIGYIQEEIAKDPSKWQFPDVEFGTDLATEHERWLAETKFDSCVFVYNYPKSIKAFYMRDNDEDNGETVNAMDLLVPGVGELVGGSQRVSTVCFCLAACRLSVAP